MNKRTAGIMMASILATGIIVQQAGASESNAIQFSGKLHTGRIQAAKNSTLGLTSMKLRGSTLGSALRLNTRAQIGGPIKLKRGAQLRVASMNMNNSYIGGSATLEMNVKVQQGISGGQNSDIGIGGVQISADDNYAPQAPAPVVSYNDGKQPGNTSGSIGSGNMVGPTPILYPLPQEQVGNTDVQSPAPSTGTGGELEPLGQRDPRWSNQKLGNSNLTLGNYGCLVTSLAMLKGTTPDKVNSTLIKNNGFSSGGYLRHDVADRVLGIGKGTRHDKTWKPDHDTIAEVRMQGKNGKSYQHFVVWRTNGTILDPWTGKVERQSKYPLVSFRDYHKG